MLIIAVVLHCILWRSSLVIGQNANFECGRTFYPPYLQSFLRIVNGVQTRAHSFPWAVSIEYQGNHDCGGVIIDQWHILTAAHCYSYFYNFAAYFVRVGAHDRQSSGQIFPIAKFILHPDYDAARHLHDIAIIKLSRSLTFSNEIQPICLINNIAEPSVDTIAYVVGWGYTKYLDSTSSSSVLLQARVRVISDCSMYSNYRHETQICAASYGPTDDDHGSCFGDSGGGLLYVKDGRWYAGGLINYAIGCGRPSFPTVHVKIAAYIDWIRKMTSLSSTKLLSIDKRA